MAFGFDQELIRKGFHLCSLFYVLIYFYFMMHFSKQTALLVLACLLLIFLVGEYLRIDRKWSIPILSRFYSNVMRGKERTRLGGHVFFMLGSILSFALFDVRIATAAILMTTFGDLASALFGKSFGSAWIPFLRKRALEGCFAEFVVDLIIGFFVVRTFVGSAPWWLMSFSLAGAPIWPVIIVMAFFATGVETIITVIDDNLAIPLVSGFAGQMVLLLLTLL